MKKGFTIVELLTVIAIISVITLIAVPTYTAVSKNIKKNMYCDKVKLIVNGAKQWGNEHLAELKKNCYIEKTVGFFVNEGYLKKEQEESGKYIMNPYTNTPMDSVKIRLFIKNKRANAWYVETTSDLINACEEPVGERPITKC